METDFMKVFTLLALLLAAHAGAAVKQGPADDLVKYRGEVMQLGARLSSLEKEIGSKNNLYLSSIEQIARFEADIKLYKSKLAEMQSQVKEAQSENRRIIQSYLVEVESDSTEVWQHKVHLELLKQAQARLQQKERELASFENRISEFDGKLSELRNNEEELAQVIKELESRKKAAMELYLSKVQDKKKAEGLAEKKQLASKMNKVRAEFRQGPIKEAKPDRFFLRPVDDFQTYSSSPKGVTFKFQAIQPVKATGKGRIVFAGDLASYGQVLLIDHGNDLRSVLLGRMDIKVKKDDVVEAGSVLAYTVNDTQEAQNLYFEIRKKNTAQNTILWLEPSSVSKI
jgi:septal ring factor EnvC (AmiA/AmiB activator)